MGCYPDNGEMPAGVAGSCVMTVSRISFRKVGLEAGGGDGENGVGGGVGGPASAER